MRTLKELAKEVLLAQDACNPLGLSRSYAEALQELRKRLEADGSPSDTRALCIHPINQMWVTKLHDLAHMGLSNQERFGKAYAACKALAE